MIKVSETLVMAFLGVIIVLAWFLVILLFVFTVRVLLSSWLIGIFPPDKLPTWWDFVSSDIRVTGIFPTMNIMRVRLA